MRRNHSNIGDIFYCLVSGGIKALDVYLQHGGSVNVTSASGEGLLSAAIQHKDSALFQWCIENGAHVNRADKFRRTPLHTAAEYDDVSAIECLVQHGGKLSARNEDGDTPLLVSVQHKNFNAAQLLLSGGADVNCANFDSHSPLCTAVQNGDQPMVSLLLTYSPKILEEPLLQAMKNKNFEVVRKILQHNQEQNGRQNFLVALLWAINNGHKVAAEMLLKHGIDKLDDVLPLIMEQTSAQLTLLVLQHHAHTTCSDPRKNNLLEYCLWRMLRMIGEKVPCKHTDMECRLTAALLHCGVSASCFSEAAKDGMFDSCGCVNIFQPHLTGTAEIMPLKIKCRTAIRCRLGFGLSQKVNSLPLPSPLKRYMMFETDMVGEILDPLCPLSKCRQMLHVWV